jgi:hypothetical protein
MIAHSMNDQPVYGFRPKSPAIFGAAAGGVLAHRAKCRGTGTA